ncbi:MAG: group 1 truncated hemoglobin [Paracoccaceae bacterium]
MTQSLFEKYGGFGMVSRIVMRLYDRILDDDDIGPFFDDIDMPALIDHQTKFVASLMDGPASFSDAHLKGAHRELDINDMHFDRLVYLVGETLSEFDVEQADNKKIKDAIEARRSLLVKATT